MDIGICTYRREQVALTLQSLAEMQIPEGVALRVIVADNDSTPSAEVLVRSVAERCTLNLTYLHAPEANISTARNAIMDAATAEYLGFIDDDEIVSIGWLDAMLERLAETRADIMLGPVQAVYADAAPEWLKRGDFHSTIPTYVNEKIITGYAGNVLMKRTTPALNHLRFALELGVSGGEDTDFFTRAYRAGAAIEFCPEATVFEGVPVERANLRWLLARRYRAGQTHALMLKQSHPSTPVRKLHAAIAAIKMLACYGMVVISIFSAARSRYWLLRGTLHVGVVRELLKK